MEKDYLDSVKKQFAYYKILGNKTFSQLSDDDFFWQFNEESNSIAMIIQHLHGNMLSRWTDFLTTDGEKDSRNREGEFEARVTTKEQVLEQWETGWQCLFDALNALTDNDLARIIYIRNMGHSVTEAINRQLAHYPYHVGQIVFIGKMLADNNWQSLSIPRGNSNQYNAEKFSKPKERRHFTDEFLTK